MKVALLPSVTEAAEAAIEKVGVVVVVVVTTVDLTVVSKVVQQHQLSQSQLLQPL